MLESLQARVDMIEHGDEFSDGLYLLSKILNALMVNVENLSPQARNTCASKIASINTFMDTRNKILGTLRIQPIRDMLDQMAAVQQKYDKAIRMYMILQGEADSDTAKFNQVAKTLNTFKQKLRQQSFYEIAMDVLPQIHAFVGLHMNDNYKDIM